MRCNSDCICKDDKVTKRREGSRKRTLHSNRMPMGTVKGSLKWDEHNLWVEAKARIYRIVTRSGEISQKWTGWRNHLPWNDCSEEVNIGRSQYIRRRRVNADAAIGCAKFFQRASTQSSSTKHPVYCACPRRADIWNIDNATVTKSLVAEMLGIGSHSWQMRHKATFNTRTMVGQMRKARGAYQGHTY